MIRFLIFIAATIAMITPAAADPFFAQLKVICAPYDDVAKHLTFKYSEAVVARGPTRMGTTIETWAAAEGKTWTVLLRQPDGTACTLSSGDAYETMPKKGT